MPGNYEQPEDHWGFYLDVLGVPVQALDKHLIITNSIDTDLSNSKTNKKLIVIKLENYSKAVKKKIITL